MAKAIKAGDNESPAKITLEQVGTDHTQDFEVEHARRILKRSERNRFDTWRLPENSQYLFKHGNLITKPGPGVNNSTAPQGAPPKGDEARAKDADAHGAGTV